MQVSKKVKEMSYQDLAIAIADPASEKDYKRECRLEMRIRIITGSGSAYAKSFVNGMICGWEDHGHCKTLASDIVDAIDLSKERTDSKTLIEALDSAKSKLIKELV